MLTNAPFMLNLDCDHYINNSKAVRESMCFLMDPQVGRRVCYVQFPQRFDGIDRHDRYANRNTVFFDVSLQSNLRSFGSLSINISNDNHYYRELRNSIFYMVFADQHERPGWNTGSCVCGYWVCFQKASSIWLRTS